MHTHCCLLTFRNTYYNKDIATFVPQPNLSLAKLSSTCISTFSIYCLQELYVHNILVSREQAKE